MIEINLLPGAGKKPRGRASRLGLAGVTSKIVSRISDPWLLTAFAAVVLAIAGVSFMYLKQRDAEIALDEKIQRAEQDSIRYAAVIREKRKAEAKRDSVLRQVELIRSIDSRRFVWPHILDEVSRAMPPYTWLTAVSQTNSPVTAPAPGADAASAMADSMAFAVISFRVVGNTVDIQALTRFMKLLESSPFIESVQLVKSGAILVDGKEVTEFQLDAAYQRPDPSAIRSVPVSLSVR